MSYKDTLYSVSFVSPKTGHVISHEGMTWDNYHQLVSRLSDKGIAYTTTEETVETKVVADEMGQAGGR